MENMDNVENIIEFDEVTKKFILIKEYDTISDNLQLLVSMAENCNSFALISMIGPKSSGKSLFLNCFFNYLENQSVWPEGCSIGYGQYFCTDKSSKKKRILIQMSRPLIIDNDNDNDNDQNNNEGHKTAVFLMDSTNVFDNETQVFVNQLTKQLISLYFSVSSTVFFLSSSDAQLNDIQENIDKLGSMINELGHQMELQELFFLMTNWESTRLFSTGQNYRYGLKNGKKFINNELNIVDLKKLFESIECYLMPKYELKPGQPSIKLDEVNEDFTLQFSRLVKTKLFCSDEMVVKKFDNKMIRPEELALIIRKYVMFLNNETTDQLDDVLNNNDILFTQQIEPDVNEYLEPNTSNAGLKSVTDTIEPAIPPPPPPPPQQNTTLISDQRDQTIQSQTNFSPPTPTPPPVGSGIPNPPPTPPPIPTGLGITNPPPPPPPPATKFIIPNHPLETTGMATSKAPPLTPTQKGSGNSGILIEKETPVMSGRDQLMADIRNSKNKLKSTKKVDNNLNNKRLASTSHSSIPTPDMSYQDSNNKPKVPVFASLMDELKVGKQLRKVDTTEVKKVDVGKQGLMESLRNKILTRTQDYSSDDDKGDVEEAQNFD